MFNLLPKTKKSISWPQSEYGEEDIRLAIEEIFPPLVAQLDSRVRLGRLSADHQCIVSLRDTLGQNVNLSWP